MFNFFHPSHTKTVLTESEFIFENLKRNRIYTQDVLKEKDLNAIKELESRYPALLKAQNVEELEKLNKEAMKFANRVFPPSPWDGWRENVEVFVVAAIMALAIRTYFLQPFKIPTGSMEPTLFGIEPVPTTKTPPNVAYQAYDFLIHGRTYSRVVTKQGGTVSALTPGSFTIWFEYTDVDLVDAKGNHEVDRIWIRLSDVVQKLNIYPTDSGRRSEDIPAKVYAPGEVLANYVTQTGDQVLVDKVTYNFRPPRRGEVFIFKTSDIPDLAHEAGSDQEGSQDFIKRCVGLEGDVVKIVQPKLYINDQLATGSPVYPKEFARIDDYKGYTLRDVNHLTIPDGATQSYYVPANCYWAMGDNSPNSRDSRYWGGVPKQNLVGRGCFVFWPFTSRWGFIR